MTVTVDISEVTQALKKIKGNYSKAEKYAVEQARDFIAKELEANTPVWNGKKSNGKRGSYMQEHAKNHVTYSKAKDGSAEVGYDDEVAWRVHFIEFGTFKQKPQAFVQKTQIQVEQEVIKIMSDIMKEALT